MNSSCAKVKNIVIHYDTLTVELTDGRVLSIPLTSRRTPAPRTTKAASGPALGWGNHPS